MRTVVHAETRTISCAQPTITAVLLALIVANNNQQQGRWDYARNTQRNQYLRSFVI